MDSESAAVDAASTREKFAAWRSRFSCGRGQTDTEE